MTNNQHGPAKWWSCSIPLLELLLLYSDYFLLLVYPLIQRYPLFQRLACSWKSTRRYQPQRPWLMEGEQVPARNCLGWELDKYLKMNQRMIEETDGPRLEALKALQEHLSKVWPWAKLQRNPVDAVERLLAWRNYDLSIVDDNWDLAGFLRTLNPPANNSTSTVASAKQELASPRLDLIYSFPQTRISVIQVGAGAGKTSSSLPTNQPTSNLNVSARESILCVRLMSASERSLNNIRSSLVFHYIQREPQLTGLYLMVSRLLELAGGLIELSADGLAAEALLARAMELGGGKGEAEEEKERAGRARKVQGGDGPRARCWHHLCVTGTGSPKVDPSYGSATGELAGPTQPSSDRLSRYALVLMLVAYLNSQSASKLKARGGPQLLARLLADFLTAYANLVPQIGAGHRVIIEPTGSGFSMHVRVVAPQTEEEAGSQASSVAAHFQIRDPASLVDSDDSSLARIASYHQKPESLINLTDTLTQGTFNRVLGLMERLSVRALALNQGVCSSEELSSSQLELLFMESEQFGASNFSKQSGTPVSNTLLLDTHTCTLARYADTTDSQNLKKSITRWQELRDGLDCATLGLVGKITGTSSCKSKPKKFKRSFAIRLVYLVIFLLLRDEIATRFSQYQSSVRARSREDWAKIKSSLMGAHDGVEDSLGWQYSGFGVDASDVKEPASCKHSPASCSSNKENRAKEDAVQTPEGSWEEVMNEMGEEKSAKDEDEIVSEAKEQTTASSTPDGSNLEEPTTAGPNDLAPKEDEEAEAEPEQAGRAGIDAKEFMGEIMKAMMQQLMESGDMDFGELMQGLNQEGLPEDWAKNFDPQTISELLKGMKRNSADNPGKEDEEEEEEEKADDDKERLDADSQEEVTEATTLSPNIDSSQTSSDSSESRDEL